MIELVSKNKGYLDPQKPPEHTIVQEAEAFSRFTFAVATEALDQYESNPGVWGLGKDLGDQKEELGDQTEDLGDQMEDLGDQMEDLGDQREDHGYQREERKNE